jgi:hypothetical protein
MPDQAARETAMRLKLNPIAEVFRGQRVVIVDDSDRPRHHHAPDRRSWSAATSRKRAPRRHLLARRSAGRASTGSTCRRERELVAAPATEGALRRTYRHGAAPGRASRRRHGHVPVRGRAPPRSPARASAAACFTGAISSACSTTAERSYIVSMTEEDHRHDSNPLVLRDSGRVQKMSREVTEAHYLHERSGLEPVLRPPVKNPTALLVGAPKKEELDRRHARRATSSPWIRCWAHERSPTTSARPRSLGHPRPTSQTVPGAVARRAPTVVGTLKRRGPLPMGGTRSSGAWTCLIADKHIILVGDEADARTLPQHPARREGALGEGQRSRLPPRVIPDPVTADGRSP